MVVLPTHVSRIGDAHSFCTTTSVSGTLTHTASPSFLSRAESSKKIRQLSRPCDDRMRRPGVVLADVVLGEVSKACSNSSRALEAHKTADWTMGSSEHNGCGRPDGRDELSQVGTDGLSPQWLSGRSANRVARSNPTKGIGSFDTHPSPRLGKQANYISLLEHIQLHSS